MHGKIFAGVLLLAGVGMAGNVHAAVSYVQSVANMTDPATAGVSVAFPSNVNGGDLLVA